MPIVSVHYLSLSRVLVIRMEFYVAKVYKCPCRMSLRRKCVSEDMFELEGMIMGLEFCVARVY